MYPSDRQMYCWGYIGGSCTPGWESLDWENIQYSESFIEMRVKLAIICRYMTNLSNAVAFMENKNIFWIVLPNNLSFLFDEVTATLGEYKIFWNVHPCWCLCSFVAFLKAIRSCRYNYESKLSSALCSSNTKWFETVFDSFADSTNNSYIFY